MSKSSFPSMLFVKYSSSRRLQESLSRHEEADRSLCNSENNDKSSRRLSLRRMSLPMVSRPQWGKRLQRRLNHRAPKQRTNSNEAPSLSSTKSGVGEEDGSIKSHLSTASSSSSPSTSVDVDLSMTHHPPRSVRFSVVQVREFDRTVGENPACKAGPSLTLDWSFVERPEEWLLDMPPVHDDGDENKEEDDHQPRTKRTLQQLHVSAERRIEMLRDEWDVTESELAAAMQVVDQIKKSRETVVTEFRQLIALKRKQQQEQDEQNKMRQNDGGSNVVFQVTRVEC